MYDREPVGYLSSSCGSCRPRTCQPEILELERLRTQNLTGKIKSLHFTRALASAAECAAALDQIEDECAAPGALLTKAREELRLCMLLTLGLRP